ncbi:MAG: hypothetical protein M1832_003691 [Thelocarpon impressellum]|nr:MAG: hypothetical protein M1832_003691 [Thelocarpon impressellum]
MGGVNCHVELRFADGVSWMARFKRQNASTPPAAVRDYIVRSEAATYSFLARTKVPVPRVFEVMLGADNPVGAGYILMEKVRGRALPSTSPTEPQKRKVLGQLAAMYAELAKHPFSTLGSLDQIGTDHIGPLASELLADLDQSGVNLLGPFSDAAEYYKAKITRILDLIVTGQLYPLWTVDAFLIHRCLLDLAPQLTLPRPVNAESGVGAEEFFLRHADDTGSHILVDADFNITGIIDWEWAYTAPRAEAFSSPMALWNVGDFFDGDNTLSEDERTFADMLDTAPPFQGGGGDWNGGLGTMVRDGRRSQRFRFCAGYEMQDWDWANYAGLFAGLRSAFGLDDADLGWAEWRARALERYHDDTQLIALLSAHGAAR